MYSNPLDQDKRHSWIELSQYPKRGEKVYFRERWKKINSRITNWVPADASEDDTVSNLYEKSVDPAGLLALIFNS